VEKAIATNPAQAELSIEDLEPIAKACISYETTKVTALSAAAGLGGGLIMAATIPADIAQLFGHIIRILQKLTYLYGWQELFDEEEELDDATTNQLTLFIGVMFGVNLANATINKVAILMAQQVEKTLIRKALTKGTIYPIVKKVAGMIGIKMTKKIFAKTVGKLIPVVGAALSGGVTYTIFKPMATRLKKHLVSLPTASVELSLANSNTIVDVEFLDTIE